MQCTVLLSPSRKQFAAPFIVGRCPGGDLDLGQGIDQRDVTAQRPVATAFEVREFCWVVEVLGTSLLDTEFEKARDRRCIPFVDAQHPRGPVAVVRVASLETPT